MPLKASPPLLVSFTITRRCNLKCKHCYADAADSAHPDELTTAEAKQTIEEIAAAGARLLIFDGGEPLLRPDIYELIAHTRELDMEPLVGTNGTLLSTETVDKLKRAGVRVISISLDGAEAKSHDEFRGREGSWERAISGIRNVANAGIPFQIAPCFHRQNLAQFEAIMQKSSGLGAKAMEIFDYVRAGRARRNPELELTMEEQHYLVKAIISRQLADEERDYRCIAIPQFWVEVDKAVPEKKERLKFGRSCCGAGIRYCCVFYEGTVYPCVLLQRSAGNIRENSFSRIWNESDVFRVLRNRDKLEGKCGRCPYRWVCGGARCKVYEKTGSLTKADDSCWYTEQELLEISKSVDSSQTRT